MTDRILFIIAFAFLAAFLAILALKVNRWDLTMVVLVTLALALWDMISTTGKRKNGA